MNYSRLFLVGLLVLVPLAGATGPVVASSTPSPAPATYPQVAGENGTNATANGTTNGSAPVVVGSGTSAAVEAANASNVTGPNVSVTDMVLNPGQTANGVVSWAKGALWGAGKQAIKDGINMVATVISGMPAQGTAGNPSSWIAPQSGLWGGVFDTWKVTVSLGLGLNGIAFTLAFRHKDRYKRRRKWKQCILSLFMIILTFPVTALGLHAAATIGTSVAPSASDFLATPGALAKLGSGALLGFLLLYLFTAVVLVGLLALLLQFVLAHLVVVFWPVAWGLRPFGGTAKSMGDTWIFLYVLLIGLNISQSIVLLTLFNLPWGASSLGTALAPVATVVGLAFALIYLPKEMLEKANDAAAVGLGLSAMNRTNGENVEQAKSEVKGRYKQVKEWRGGGNDDSPAPSSGGVPSTGAPGVSSGSKVRRRGAGTFGSSGGGAAADGGAPRSTPDGSSDRERQRIDHQTRDRGIQ